MKVTTEVELNHETVAEKTIHLCSQHTRKPLAIDNTSIPTDLYVSVKRNLIGYCIIGARMLCTEETLEAELQTVRTAFMENGFLSRLIDEVIQTERGIPRRMLMERKAVYISLPLNSGKLEEIVQKRRTGTTRKTNYAPELRILFQSHPVV